MTKKKQHKRKPL